MTAAPGRPAPLSSFFAPESIAIIGASDDIDRIAGRPLHALRTFGYGGRLHAVNPTRPMVQGLPTVAHIGDLPGPVDLAILVVPAKRVLEAARECAAAGTRHLVVFAGGFAETGNAGRLAQLELQQVGRASGMRILGPNCLGMINFDQRVFATFTRAAADWSEAGGAALQKGPRSLAVVTQSGALGNYMLTQAIEMGLQVGKWVATGNEVDIEFAEVLEAVIEDPSVCGVLAYLEGARNGPALVRALRRARDLKVPVALIKVGSTDAGAKAVMSHTDALAGDDRVFDALFAETGALRARTIEDLLGIGQLMLRARPAGGRRVLLTTISGGVGAMMAEACVGADLALPGLSDATRATLLAKVPFMSPNNPLDVTGQVTQDFDLLRQAMTPGLADTAADIAITFIGRLARVPAALAAYVDTIDELGRQFPDVIFITVGMFDAPTVRRLHDAGGLVFTDPSRAVDAARSLAAMGAAFARAPRERPRVDDMAAPAPAGPPNEADGYRLLAAAGIPVPAFHRLESGGSVSGATTGLAAPYVLKVLSADIAHKSDIGGVRLPLADANEVAQAWNEMREAVALAAPRARIDGALLMSLQRDFVEVVIGARVDDQLGPVVMVGLGGVFVELLNDIAVRLAPVSAAEALAMIESLKGVRLLHGLRGHPARDIEALADAVSRLSRLIAANAGWMQSIEINPFAVRARGQGGNALDCAIQLKPETT